MHVIQLAQVLEHTCQSRLILNFGIVKAYFYIDTSKGASMQTKQIQATQHESLCFL